MDMESVTEKDLLCALLTSDEALIDLQEAALAEIDFISDVERGTANAESDELISQSRIQELNTMISLTRVMPEFDSMAFRNWVLASWRCTAIGQESNFNEHEIEAYESLSDEEKTSAEKLVADFLHVRFDQQRLNAIEETVKSHLAENRCGKARKINTNQRPLRQQQIPKPPSRSNLAEYSSDGSAI